jgi:Leucine-rich repeat (LRR) protein
MQSPYLYVLCIVLSTCFLASSYVPPLNETEYNFLKEFYHSTNGPFWSYTFTSGIPWDFQGGLSHSNPCDAPIWAGITCYNDYFANISSISHLELQNNNLNGSIPSSIRDLSHLLYIRLENNFLSGNFPSLSGSPLSQSLILLDLHFNHFTGTFPFFQDFPFLGYINGRLNYFTKIQGFQNLSFLGEIDMLSNLITGEFPSLLNLPNLQIVDLSFNLLNGTFPTTTISILPKLTSFQLIGNHMCGSLPSLSLFPSLSTLNLIFNRFSGNLESLFDNNITSSSPHPIKELSLIGNQLTGSIPSQSFTAEKLPYLTTLDIAFNSLNNSIPSFCNFSMLTTLVLTSNNFSGKVGKIENNTMLSTIDFSLNKIQSLTSITNLPALQVLNLLNNALEGTLIAISHLPLLRSIDLSHNQLKRCSSFSNLSSITELNIQQNQLTTFIPSLNEMKSTLRMLLLSDNVMKGTIPDFINFTSLISISLERNELSGTLPVFRDLPELSTLIINNNQLSGTVPSFYDLHTSDPTKQFQFHQSINFLNLANNQFTGFIPSFDTLMNLANLYLQHNKFSGSIPSFNKMLNLFNLDLSYNHFTGSFPSLSHLNSTLYDLDLTSNALSGNFPLNNNFSNLHYLYLAENHFQANLNHFAKSLVVIEEFNISFNYFTSTISSQLLNKPLLYLFDVGENQLVGKLPEILENSRLHFFNIHHNSITGTLPTSLSVLTRLEGFDVSFNFLYGKIHDSLPVISRNLKYCQLSNNHFSGNLYMELIDKNYPKLSSLDISNNNFIGSPYINQLILKFSNLILLSFSNNILTGELSNSIATLQHLEWIDLRSNQFHGYLPSLFNASFQSNLSFIDFSDNQFTGTIPNQLFTILRHKLEVIAFSKNCLKGSLPSEICESSNLTVLALDGLGNADHCQQKLFPSTSLKSYKLKHPIEGDIPTCLFSQLPKLTTLHLSGNGLVGSLPNNLPSDSALSDLSLSYNQLTGTIPSSIQSHNSWKSLDLSFNRFSGLISKDISSSFFSSSSSLNSSLSLKVNRLSGEIPKQLISSAKIDILTGNMFDCSSSSGSSSNLPENDPAASSYTCGSKPVNDSLIAWIVIAIFLAIVIIGEMTYHRKRVFSIFFTSRSRDEKTVSDKEFGSEQQQQQQKKKKSQSSFIPHSLLVWWNQTISFDTKLGSESVLSSIFGNDSSSIKFLIQSIENVSETFFAIRVVAFLLLICAIVLFLPVYSFLSSYRTHYDTYIWQISLAYLSGSTAAAIIFVFYFLVFCYWLCLYEKANDFPTKT